MNKFSIKPARNWFKSPIFWILLLALTLRVIAALYLGNSVTGLSGASDEITYSTLGHRVATGHGLSFPENWYPWIQADTPQSYFSAAMSLSLGAIYAVFGYYPLVARLIMALVSTAVVGLLYLLTRRIFNARIALIAAGLAAVYPYLIFYGVSLVTETPFILGLLVAIYLAYEIVENPSPAKWVALGLVMALTAVFRIAIVFYIPFLLGWVFFKQKQQRHYVILPLIAIVLMVMPFTIRNYILWGEFEPLETQFGHVFWNGNHPDHEGDFHPYKVFPIPEEVLALNNDSHITKTLLRMGIDNVLDDPGHFVMLTLTRLRELFKFWPTPDSSLLANLMRVFSFGLLWPVALAGILFSYRRWLALLPIWLFIFIHTGIYASSWTMIRYRVPLDTLFIIFAALAVVAVWDELMIRRREQVVASLVSDRAAAD
jgi:4-amino-4-deoxy-L-arabinose transferase-like glycosyltransferase